MCTVDSISGNTKARHKAVSKLRVHRGQLICPVTLNPSSMRLNISFQQPGFICYVPTSGGPFSRVVGQHKTNSGGRQGGRSRGREGGAGGGLSGEEDLGGVGEEENIIIMYCMKKLNKKEIDNLT